MKQRDITLAKEISDKLNDFEKIIELPGIATSKNKECLIAQIIDSIRRVKYVGAIAERDISPNRINPSSEFFDPIRASIWHKERNDIDEAIWLIFLFVHFGKNKRTGWKLLRDVYSGENASRPWRWSNIVYNLDEFKEWLDGNYETFQSNGKFGNHRKYESCNAYQPRGTGAAISTYIDWIGPEHDHRLFIENANQIAGDKPRMLFDHLYKSMNKVATFGRMAKFDYLCMLGKVGLVTIEPGHTYLQGATGPIPGAKLLFGGSTNAIISLTDLNSMIAELEKHLGFPFGMQILEDSLCNWQKSPNNYVYFGG